MRKKPPDKTPHSVEITGRSGELLDGLRRRVADRGWLGVGESDRGEPTDAALIEAALERLDGFGPMPVEEGAEVEAEPESPREEIAPPAPLAPPAAAWPPAPPIDLPAAPPICPKCGTREITPGGADLCAACMVQRALGF